MNMFKRTGLHYSVEHKVGTIMQSHNKNGNFYIFI